MEIVQPWVVMVPRHRPPKVDKKKMTQSAENIPKERVRYLP